MQGSRKLDCIFCIGCRAQKLGLGLELGGGRVESHKSFSFHFFSWLAIYLTRISPENKYLDDVQFRLEILPLVVEIQRLYTSTFFNPNHSKGGFLLLGLVFRSLGSTQLGRNEERVKEMLKSYQNTLWKWGRNLPFSVVSLLKLKEFLQYWEFPDKVESLNAFLYQSIQKFQ